MDESAFLQRRVEVIERPCAFEKAILTSCVFCGLTERIQIAEREVIGCRHSMNHSRCSELHDALHQSFIFALGKTHADSPLTHAQEMRVQCGGLQGLKFVLQDRYEVESVDALLKNALQKWEKLSEIPYSEVVHAASICYKGRHV